MTAQQQTAANPAHSVWVSANAGTGKTKVLTDRVLRLLLSGTAPSRILCITYTNAAAAEMANRIHERLEYWAVADTATLRGDIAALTESTPAPTIIARARRLFAEILDAAEGVRIQTIHSFCQSVLRRFPLEAGVTPYFTLIDERSAAELLYEARNRLYMQSARGDQPHLTKAMAALGAALSESGFAELIESIVRKRSRFQTLFARPAGVIRLITEGYDMLGLHYGMTEDDLFRRHLSYSGGELAARRAAIPLLTQAQPSDVKLAEGLARWLAADEEERKKQLAPYHRLFLTKDGEKRKRIITAEIIKRHPAVAETMLAEQERAYSHAQAVRSLHAAQGSEHAISIAESLLALYGKLKSLRGAMDYDDLILSTRALLMKPGIAPWVMYKLDGGLDHLLVDEAQDTSPEQWDIIRLLAEDFFSGESRAHGPRTLFAVGDEKQSIYSFQGADPQGFDRMRVYFAQQVKQARQSFLPVQLDISFRSTPAVLKAVDAVFSQPAAAAGVTLRQENMCHRPIRIDAPGRVEWWPLVEPDEKHAEAPWQLPSPQSASVAPVQAMAQRIAATVRRWVGNRLLAARGRPVTAGDILILVPRRSVLVDDLTRALKQRGIAVAGADRLLLTGNLAVMDMMALGHFALLPEDDLNLAALLKSPLVGLNEEELFTLAYDRGESSLWQRLLHHGQAHPAFARAADALRRVLARADRMPPYEFFSHMLEVEEGRKRIIARLGQEVVDPLNEFMAEALHYEQLHAPSLQGFLQWIAGGDSEIKRDQEQPRDEVRIMTVHGAKGLQAPIVFLPDMVGTPPSRDRLFDIRQDGLSAMLWSGSARRDPQFLADRRTAMKSQEMEEYRRLLYVAMTRAQDELYLCGYKNNGNALSKESWYALAEPAIKALATHFPAGGEADFERWVIADDEGEACAEPCAPSPPDALRRAVPLFLYQQAKPEKIGAPALTPSQFIDNSGASSPLAEETFYERGRLIHRLLELLPVLPAFRQREAAHRLITRHDARIGHKATAIAEEVLGVIHHPEFAPVFAPGSVAEAPIAGLVEDGFGNRFALSGQIDRLCVGEDAVWVVDYKTHAAPPSQAEDIPVPYLKQLAAYRLALMRIYPRKTVHCALLWTATPCLMPVPAGLLEIQRLALDSPPNPTYVSNAE